MVKNCLIVASFLGFTAGAYGAEIPKYSDVEPQAFTAQVARLEEALSFIGSSLQPGDIERIAAIRNRAPSPETVLELQTILDPYCLAWVEINPEARVKVMRGPAEARLIEGGWKNFLIKVRNDAAVNSALEVESPNSQPLFHRSTGAKRAKPENLISAGEVANRFLELEIYRRRPMLETLSGLNTEYAILQVYSRDSGKREGKIGFHVGQGTQDIGFRNTIDVLFDCQPSVEVVLKVKDHDGSPVMASFVITDGVDRLASTSAENPFPRDYRSFLALRRPFDATLGVGLTPIKAKRLIGVYPLPSRRLATEDEYADFFFQPQVYRADGEKVYLPPGTYQIDFTRGPEYLPQTRKLTVPEGAKTIEASFQLKRWIHMAELGWYSADHHVHAAGCSHYESPAEGVDPEHMWRQLLGEDLNIASVLSWGPSWYHQKQFFEGKVHDLSSDRNLMRYDVEVSGFPSSHAGHLCLLRLKEDDYPGTTEVEEWPSWTVPVLQWGKSQGGVVGYSHSGWGLQPMEPTGDLPNYVMPKFNGIGANEYIVAVTHDAVDFISAGDTPSHWELNIWYHTLNSGFRTRISGETDFPCIFDERVGMARTYAKLDGGLDFDQFADRLKSGISYVSDGRSHIIDFGINQHELTADGAELKLDGPGRAQIKARVAAYLPEDQDEIGAYIASREQFQPPYWHIERARVGTSRMVPVELIVNGESVATQEISADGEWESVAFEYPLERSSWVALRILPSSHTNPIFVEVNDQPIRASRKSAEWCRAAVDKCWEMKSPRIRAEDLEAARVGYDKARQIYDRIIGESVD